MGFIFIIFVLLYAFGEGDSEAITHQWKDGNLKRSPYYYHGIRAIESIGIIGMVKFYSSLTCFLLIPLYILVFRFFYCIESNEYPLIKTIGKQGKGQSGIYRLKVFKKNIDIKFPSTALQIFSSFIGLATYFILAGGK